MVWNNYSRSSLLWLEGSICAWDWLTGQIRVINSKDSLLLSLFSKETLTWIRFFFCHHWMSGDTNLTFKNATAKSKKTNIQIHVLLYQVWALQWVRILVWVSWALVTDACCTTNPLFVKVKILLVLLPSLELSQILGIITNNTVDFETICSLSNLQQSFSSLTRDSFSDWKADLFCFLCSWKLLENAQSFHNVEAWGETRKSQIFALTFLVR